MPWPDALARGAASMRWLSGWPMPHGPQAEGCACTTPPMEW